MKVNKSSWHYKYRRFLKNFFELNLPGSWVEVKAGSVCGYVTPIVTSPIWLPVLAVTLLVFGPFAVLLNLTVTALDKIYFKTPACPFGNIEFEESECQSK